jgi:hypothetical protein
MKGIVILAAAFVMGLSPMIGGTNEFMGPVPTIPLRLNGSDWQRIDPGTWEATTVNGKAISYRIDRKNDGGLVLYHSVDGFKWEVKDDQVWNDNEGNHFRVIHNNVAFSDDGGISWTELKHCVWQDPRGRWMMLDGEGRLWRIKDAEQNVIESN